MAKFSSITSRNKNIKQKDFLRGSKYFYSTTKNEDPYLLSKSNNNNSISFEGSDYILNKFSNSSLKSSPNKISNFRQTNLISDSFIQSKK